LTDDARDGPTRRSATPRNAPSHTTAVARAGVSESSYARSIGLTIELADITEEELIKVERQERSKSWDGGTR
jgi:hypothetical protein